MKTIHLFFAGILVPALLFTLSCSPTGSEAEQSPEAPEPELPAAEAEASPEEPGQEQAKAAESSAEGPPAGVESATERDPLTGMIIAENWELARANCIICHSPQQFLRQRGNRSTWQSVVDWMQKDHGLLWLVDPEVEDKIVTYLAENYAPEAGNYRRAPIAATLMPRNPYRSEAKKEFEEKKAKGLIPNGAPN